MDLLLHPYLLTLYGVLLWQIEQAFVKGLHVEHQLGLIGRSLIWCGMIVVFDDEILYFLSAKFDILVHPEWYFYMTAGFLVDIIRNKITKDGYTPPVRVNPSSPDPSGGPVLSKG